MRPSLTILTTAALAGTALLGACSAQDDASTHQHSAHSSSPAAVTGSAASEPSSSAAGGTASTGDHGHHDGMEHEMDGGPAPEGITEASSPRFPVGTEVTLTADHMPGMQGATATIAGAYDTTTYAVDYTPTTGGEEVSNHKWVVHEELQDPGQAPLAEGDEATLLATHMKGMKGARATISEVTDETVYMVDLMIDGQRMTHHKWVVESELEPAQ